MRRLPGLFTHCFRQFATPVFQGVNDLALFNFYCTMGPGTGCFIANLIGGNGILDVVFGTLGTVLAAFWTSRMRRDWLAPMPPMLINMLVIGAVLDYTLTPGTFWASFVLFAADVWLGQLGTCNVLAFGAA